MASTWRETVTSVGTAIPLNGLSREKAASCCGLSQLRLPPRIRPPRRNFTGTRLSSPRGKMWPGKAHKDATIVDPLIQAIGAPPTLPTSARRQDRQTPVQKSRHGFSRCNALGKTDVGKWIERAGEIVACADQRLRAVGSSEPGHDPDRVAAPTLVEQLHGAGRTLADDVQPRHIVADFDRQFDRGVKSRVRRI